MAVGLWNGSQHFIRLRTDGCSQHINASQRFIGVVADIDYLHISVGGDDVIHNLGVVNDISIA